MRMIAPGHFPGGDGFGGVGFAIPFRCVILRLFSRQFTMSISLSSHFSYGKLLRFTLPSILMMIFTSLYVIVDGLFVSNFVGKNPFAAINLIMPFVMVVGGMGFMLGSGGTALVAKILGEGDRERASRTFTMILVFSILLGAVLTVLGVIFIRPVSVCLGATEELLDDCVVYGAICIAFTIPFMLQNLFQTFLVAAERPRMGLYITLAAGTTNMILDALFIVGFGWGVAGAAVATGLSQCVGGIIPILFFRKRHGLAFHLTPVRLEFRPILDACANGSSELMNNISGSFVAMLYNWQLLKYAGADGVSAYGVLLYVGYICIAIFVGYSVGAAPIVAFHYGAGNHSELKSMLVKSCKLNLSIGVLAFLSMVFLARQMAAIFVGFDKELCDLTVHAFRLFSLSFLLSGFNIYASSFFTALNNGPVSAAISFMRTLVFQGGAVMVMPLAMGVDGIWWSLTVAEAFAALVSFGFLVKMRGKYHYWQAGGQLSQKCWL